jgi:glyceraldehyde 3-phosphate dehydrogenase
MSLRIGLMGFGRIGRNIFRILYPGTDIEIRAIVDVADAKALEYLLKFDTVHGRFREPVSVKDGAMYVKGRQIRMINAKAPGDVDWAALDVDVVIEATGQYRTREVLQKHLDRGARTVILTVPPRTVEDVDALIVSGVNDDDLKPSHRIVSNGSCTINAMAPILKVLDDNFGVQQAFMTSIHAYTNDQRLADVPGKDLRRSRAAAENIIPTSTYSPRGIGRILSQLEGKLEGLALNVPVPDGSCVDLSTLLARAVTRDEVNEVMRSAAATTYRNIIEYSEDPLVSSDVIGNSHSAIFDSLATMVVGGDLVKTIVWYDNGWGYATRVVELIRRVQQLRGAPVAA